MVQVRKCIVRDTAGGKCDSLEIEFENAAGWYSWGPEEDDTIVVAHKGYDSGVMFVNSVIPEDGKYRIIATSLPCKARAKGYQSFHEKTLKDIIKACAMASGMSYKLLGVEGDVMIPYIEREYEGCAAFLNRLLSLEGAVLKCVNGNYAAIGIDYAQERNALQTAVISAQQTGVQYFRNGQKYRSITVRTPYAKATAIDELVSSSHAQVTINYLPASNDLQAKRWACGKLLWINRQCESVVIKSEFNAAMTAMNRVDIVSDTDASGNWVVAEVEHDLFNETSTTTLNRCIVSIV
ncbi:MAG: hypothetical protein Q4B09_05375 [Lachnospiraceae bacterium]|nr:hypothetical protein [Lachnospiraceae bacterium]